MSQNQSDAEQSESNDDHTLATDLRTALLGGGSASAIAIATLLAVNVGSGSEARDMLQAMMPSVRSLASGLLPSTTTLLALILTAISFSFSADVSIKGKYYKRVRQIALTNVITFTAAVLLLLFATMPILQQSEDIPNSFYQVIYYSVLVYASLLGGAAITILLMMYQAIISLIEVAQPEKESTITADS